MANIDLQEDVYNELKLNYGTLNLHGSNLNPNDPSLRITGPTTTSPSSGALVISGGAGISGDLNIGGKFVSEKGDYTGYTAYGNSSGDKTHLLYQMEPIISQTVSIIAKTKISGEDAMNTINFSASSSLTGGGGIIGITFSCNHEIDSGSTHTSPVENIPRIDVYDATAIVETITISQEIYNNLQEIGTGYAFGDFKPTDPGSLLALYTPIGDGSASDNYWICICKNIYYDPDNILATSDTVAYNSGDGTLWCKFVFSTPITLDTSAVYSFCLKSDTYHMVAPYNFIFPVPDDQRWGIWNMGDPPKGHLEALYNNRQCVFKLVQSVIKPMVDICLYVGNVDTSVSDVKISNNKTILACQEITAPSLPVIYTTKTSPPNITKHLGSVEAEQIIVNGIASFLNTDQAVSATTGSIICSGGIGLEKDLTTNGGINIILDTDAGSVTSGSLITRGGLGVGKSIFCGGSLNVIPTTQSTSITSGAAIIAGGVGIGKNLFVGSSLFLTQGSLTIPAGTGPFNNISIPNQNIIIMINNADIDANLTGFIVGTGNINGHKLDFYCDSGNRFILKELDIGSASSNQLKMCVGGDLSLNPPCYFSLLYLTTYSKWIVIAQRP